MCSPLNAPRNFNQCSQAGAEISRPSGSYLLRARPASPKLVMHTLLNSVRSDHRRCQGEFRCCLEYLLRHSPVRRAADISAGDAGGRISGAVESRMSSIGDFLIRLGIRGTTHISGTPSHWRRALMSHLGQCHRPSICSSVRRNRRPTDFRPASGNFYPGASVIHAFASTEAGVAFDVPDGLAGFPASLLGRQGPVEIKFWTSSLTNPIRT